MDNYLMKKWLFTDAPENLPELADQLYLILFNLLTFLDKLKRLILQFWTEHICQLFHVLAQFFFHHKWNATRLLSPENKCTSFLTSCRMT